VLAPAYGTSPENWSAATAYVLARATPSDCVVFYPADARMPFRYYLEAMSARAGARAGLARAPAAVLPALPWADPRPFVEDYATLTPVQVAALPARCPQLWLVAGHVGTRTGSPSARANYARYLALRSALRRRYGLGRSASFGYAPAVRVDEFTDATSSPRTSAR
jgi:hypothetical protein